MYATKLISVRCGACGQVYHVPPPETDRRAKCRPCGHEFLIPSSPNERIEMQRECNAPRHAAADRIAAAQMAADVSTQHRLQSWRKRWCYVGAVCSVIPLLLGAIGYSAFFAPPTDRAAAEKMHRGRVAKLSAPHSMFEFASVAELIEAVEPSVVQIETRSGFGSGFVLDESGLIVTCRHCIETAFEATVVFADGRRAPVTGIVVDSTKADVAVLSIEPTGPLVPLPLATRTPRKGEPIVAFGSPAGLSFSTSEGSVSGLRTPNDLANLPGAFRMGLGLAPRLKLVQITASTMPGTSGGPVVDFSGNVIGISSFGLNWHGHEYEFCISAEEIRKLVFDLDLKVRPLWIIHTDDYREEF